MSAREQRLVFGEDPDLYDRARPSYPDPLIDDVVTWASEGAGPDGVRAVDAGCGTGKATVLLAERGVTGVGVEPHPAMAAVARRNLAPWPRWEIVVSGFEGWDGPTGAFDLVTAAQSWHWMDPERRIRQAHRLLRPGGWLALFWNTATLDPAVRSRLDEVYARRAPQVTGWMDKGSTEHVGDPPADAPFGPPVERAYEWERSLTRAEYVDLLGTQSDHRLLPDEVREALLADVAAVVDGAGGRLHVHQRTLLWAAPAAKG